jgi:VWFA-related protein
VALALCVASGVIFRLTAEATEEKAVATEGRAVATDGEGRSSRQAAGGAAGQEPSQQPPIFRTEANFVRVDVYPTSGGRPVMDLRAEDFELLEDGKPQSIDTFEHVIVAPGGPQAARVDPNTMEASRQLAANPRNRVFVIFLDVSHVGKMGAHAIREPIIRFIDRILGPDDLVAVMTASMAASEIVFARKTEVIERGLRARPFWGEKRDEFTKGPTLPQDEREEMYQLCYPFNEGLAERMIVRRRERMTLDALKDLVRYLRALREERKAIITISEGWALFRPDETLLTLGRGEEIPGRGRVGVGPDGRLTTDDPRGNTHPSSKTQCDADRMTLAAIDNWQYLQDLWGEANRGNASFYMIDPRGLVATATHGEYLRERAHQDAMRMLASNTDGLAMTTSNDLDSGLRRIADDLQSYYLLGYYSTNTKLDGRFRSIRVRVKRPGVEVRARKGYRAATAEEVAAIRAAAAAPSSAKPPPSAVASAMSALARLRSESRFHVYAVLSSAATGGGTAVWVAGELQPAAANDPWTRGGTAAIDVTADGTSGSGRATLKPGERAFLTRVELARPVTAGSIDVRAKLSGAAPDAPPLADSVRVDAAAGRGGALLFRRGPSTGNRLQPAALQQFSRTERLRIEVPVAAGVTAGTARLVDKAGQTLTVPVTVGERTDEQSGQRWLTGDITLAPLGAGDYAIELTVGNEKLVTAVRVVR